MAQLSIQKIVEAGILHTFANADTVNGDKFKNFSGKVFLLVKNTGASAATVTINAIPTSKNDPDLGVLSKTDPVISLAAGDEKLVGPFKKGAFNDGAGDVSVAYGGLGAADVDVAALELSE
jgi:hypothetical protein